MISKPQKQMFEDALASFLATGNPDLLNWFIGIDDKYQSKLFASETIMRKFWGVFVNNGPHNYDIFNHLATKTPEQSRVIVIELFSSLISSKNPALYSTLLKVFSEKYADWPSEINASMQNICLKTASEVSFPDDSGLFHAALNTISKLSDDQYEIISKILVSRITNENANIRDDAIKLLNLVSKKTRLRDPIGIRECIEYARTLLNNNDVTAKPLLEYVFNHLNRLLLTQQTQLIDLITEQIHLSKPNPIKLLALDFIPQLVTELNRKNILDIVIELAKSVSENDTKERCKIILKELGKKHLTSKKEKEVKDIFGDIEFD